MTSLILAIQEIRGFDITMGILSSGTLNEALQQWNMSP